MMALICSCEQNISEVPILPTVSGDISRISVLADTSASAAMLEVMRQPCNATEFQVGASIEVDGSYSITVVEGSNYKLAASTSEDVLIFNSALTVDTFDVDKFITVDYSAMVGEPNPIDLCTTFQSQTQDIVLTNSDVNVLDIEVLDADDNPLEGVKVGLFVSEDLFKQNLTSFEGAKWLLNTNESGQVRLAGLEEGVNYFISVYAEIGNYVRLDTARGITSSTGSDLIKFN